MIYLVDANVLCEPTKSQGEPRVLSWLIKYANDLAVDAVIMGEIWEGIVSLPEGKRKRSLETWFAGSPSALVCLDWTVQTALVWAELRVAVRRNGFTVGVRDTMIAATAKRHGLTVATRNVSDFARCGVAVVDPFA